jgi:hypothetical protein
MHTYSNRAVFPEDSEYHTGEHPTLDDIAIGLSRTMRFAGQTPHPYSVLCHTFVVATLLDDGVKIHGLLHDAAEAIVGDVPTPWKAREHANNEGYINSLLYKALEVPPPTLEQEEQVFDVDHAVRAAEAHALGHRSAQQVWPREKFDELEQKAYDLTVNFVAQGMTMQFFTQPDLARQTYIQNVTRAMPGQSAAQKLHIPTGQVPK